MSRRVFDPPLAIQRYRAVADILDDAGVERFLDVGCGNGRGLATMLTTRAPATWRGDRGCLVGDGTRLCRFVFGVGVDLELTDPVNVVALAHVNAYLPLHVSLWQGDFVKGRIDTLTAYLQQNAVDAACCIEVIEHIDTEDLPAFSRAFFTLPGMRMLVVTTPNRDANALMGMAPGVFRHDDHRFEFSQAEFEEWSAAQAAAHAWRVSFGGVGALRDGAGRTVHASSVAVFLRDAPDARPPGGARDATGGCALPACVGHGGCAWVERRVASPQASDPADVREILFASSAHSWLAYNVTHCVYDTLSQGGVRKHEEWVPLLEVVRQGAEPLAALFEHSPDLVKRLRDEGAEAKERLTEEWVARCIKEAYDLFFGLVLDVNYVPLHVKLAGCKWCGYGAFCSTCADRAEEYASY